MPPGSRWRQRSSLAASLPPGKTRAIPAHAPGSQLRTPQGLLTHVCLLEPQAVNHGVCLCSHRGDPGRQGQRPVSTPSPRAQSLHTAPQMELTLGARQSQAGGTASRDSLKRGTGCPHRCSSPGGAEGGQRDTPGLQVYGCTAENIPCFKVRPEPAEVEKAPQGGVNQPGLVHNWVQP